MTVNEEPRRNKTQHKQEAIWGGPAGRPLSVLRADNSPPCAGSRGGGTICTSSEKRPQQLCLWRVSGASLIRKLHQLLQLRPPHIPMGVLGPPHHQALAQALLHAWSTPPHPQLYQLAIAMRQMIPNLATENNKSSECQKGKSNIEMTQNRSKCN